MQHKIAFCRQYLKRAKNIYLVGIGGIGMSGLAYLLKDKGYKVSGSDIVFSPLLAHLEKKGIAVYLGHKSQRVKGKDLLCYSSAIKEDNPELKRARKLGIPLVSRGLLLACLAQEEKVIAIAGSHGKTTTTALTGFLLRKMGLRCSTFLGGMLQGHTVSAEWGREVFVIETDESDGSFNFIRPFYSLITNIDREHLNFYQNNWGKLKGAFRRFAEQTTGKVIGCADDEAVFDILSWLPSGRSVSYGIRKGDFRACHITFSSFSTRFDLCFYDKKLLRWEIPLAGRHNVLNSLAAIAAIVSFRLEGKLAGREKEIEVICLRLKEDIKYFPGVKRRLEILGKKKSVIFISDYAHHPSEIKAVIRTVKSIKSSRLVVVFQPHRPSRLKSLISEFADAFYGSDLLIVTDIYLASEKPEKNINAALLIENLRHPSPKNIIYLPQNKLMSHLSSFFNKGDIVLALGAGNIDSIIRSVYRQF